MSVVNGVSLLIANGRVAPIKEITLARLELLVATVSVRLTSHITDNFIRKARNVRLPTHCQIVSCWIKPSKTKYVFVRNHAAEIKRKPNEGQWGCVKMDKNPAVFMTRGMRLKHLLNSELW